MSDLFQVPVRAWVKAPDLRRRQTADDRYTVGWSDGYCHRNDSDEPRYRTQNRDYRQGYDDGWYSFEVENGLIEGMERAS